MVREPFVSLGGATGSAWGCGDSVLRIGNSEVIRREILVMRAASGALPVPEVLAAADFIDDQQRPRAALLLTRLPGRPAADLADVSPARARRLGEVCGHLHAALATVSPPPGLRAAPAAPASDASATPCLLHLDLHPFNVLLNKAGEVSGVLDWANAAAGPAVLDRARTWSILTLDPDVQPFRAESRREALLQGWARTAEFAELPAAARAWACRFMLSDLAERHPASRLDPIRRYLTDTLRVGG
jgi:Ser/Thr protein kinase RdoA (MazF antagonist)